MMIDSYSERVCLHNITTPKAREGDFDMTVKKQAGKHGFILGILGDDGRFLYCLIFSVLCNKILQLFV